MVSVTCVLLEAQPSSLSTHVAASFTFWQKWLYERDSLSCGLVVSSLVCF